MPRNNYLRQKRIQQNWRQQDLADHIGTTVLSVQRWERGTHQPSLYYRTKLCTLFASSPQELGFVEETSPFPASVVAPEASPSTPLERSSQQTRIWTIPYARNPLFTGREDLLAYLDQQFASSTLQASSQQIRQVALTQSQALYGLGGIGKTQIAIEYAYHCLQEERYIHTLWISAASEEAILTSFAKLATLLPEMSQPQEQDAHKIAQLVILWLEQCDVSWLLLFDNADAIELVSSYFPTRGDGSILLTTRASAVGSMISPIEVETMGIHEGAQLLLRRAHRIEQASDDEINEASNIVIALGQFPLAIDQAGAYIEETRCSLAAYLLIYKQHRRELLARRGTHAGTYPDSVATTWSLSFQHVEQKNPAAAQFLQLCAFLAPDHIPEELLINGASYWPPALQRAATDPFLFNEMLETLLAFSLIKRHSEEHTISIHRLVQAVQADRLPSQEQRQWIERMILAINASFPHDPTNPVTDWPRCQRYLEQAQISQTLIQQYHIFLPEAAHLLTHTGTYLRARNLYTQAEVLYQHALQVWEHVEVQDSTQIALVQNNLGDIYNIQGNYSEAKSLFQLALNVLDQQGEANGLEGVNALAGLAFIAVRRGEGQAEDLYLSAIHLLEQHQPNIDNTLLSDLLFGLGYFYIEKGRYPQAEPLCRRALHVVEQHLGPHTIYSTQLLLALSCILDPQGKYEEAEALCRHSLEISEQHLPPEHPMVVPALLRLADILTKQDIHAEAETLLLRALHIREQLLEADNYLLSYPLKGLADLYQKQKRYAEAETLYQRALHICTQHIEPDSSLMIEHLLGLANLYTRQEQYLKAQSFFQQALLICELSAEKNNLATAQVLYDYGCFQQAQGQQSEAILSYQRALSINKHMLGPTYLATIETRNRLSAALIASGRTEEATTL